MATFVDWKLGDEDKFIEEIYQPLWDDEETNGDRARKHVRQAADEANDPNHPDLRFKEFWIQMEIMLTAIAYSIQALRGDQSSPETWRYACEANYFLGLVTGISAGRCMYTAPGGGGLKVGPAGGPGNDIAGNPSKGTSGFNGTPISAIHIDFAEIGKAGAAKRWGKWEPLRKYVLEKYAEGTWMSANQAAHALRDDAIAHGRTIGVALKTENAQRTLAEWIRKSV